MEDIFCALLEFVHDLFSGAVKIVLGADIAAAFHDRSLNIVGQGGKKYFCRFAASQKAVKIFIFSHTFYFLSRKYILRFFAEYTRIVLTVMRLI